MLTINIPEKYNAFVEEYSKKLTLNGKSNLSEEKLALASRTEYQCSGLFGEIALHIYHYGHADNLAKIIDAKLQHYNITKEGDNGQDDVVEINGQQVNIDIKTSHITNEKKIRSLNLIVSENEFHPNNQIYIAGFSIGESRSKVSKVILAGWIMANKITKRWPQDKTKWCAPTRDLNDMMKLERYIRQ